MSLLTFLSSWETLQWKLPQVHITDFPSPVHRPHLLPLIFPSPSLTPSKAFHSLPFSPSYSSHLSHSVYFASIVASEFWITLIDFIYILVTRPNSNVNNYLSLVMKQNDLSVEREKEMWFSISKSLVALPLVYLAPKAHFLFIICFANIHLWSQP